MPKLRFQILAFSVFYFSFSTSYSQNLVPNPSFETYTSCPGGADELYKAPPWFKPTTGTPDYFNTCSSSSTGFDIPITQFGFSFANSGSAMSGIDVIDNIFGGLIYREYLAVKLISPLIISKKYFVTYFARLPDSVRYATNQINIYFGDSIYKNSFDTINVIPQIQNPVSNFITNKTMWTKLRGSFIANGGEKYLYVGDFKHPITNDTLFVNGGNKFAYNVSYYFIDDICVSDDSLYSENWITSITEYEKSNFYFFPNPINDRLYLKNFESGSVLTLSDIQGREIQLFYEYNQIDLSKLPEGIYFLRYTTPERKSYNYKLIKK